MRRPQPGSSKASWRKWAREEWRAIDPSRLSPKVAGHLSEFQPIRRAKTILLYFPMAHELDVTALLANRMVTAAFTATRTPASGPLTLHRLGLGPLEEHRFGFQQPASDAPHVDPGQLEVALVPGMCFAGGGARIGHGAGYFDEFLGALRPDAALIGVTPARLVVEELPHGPYDVAMTHLATELGVSSCRT